MPNDVIDRLIHFRPTDAPVLSAYIGIPSDPGEIRGVESRFRSALKPVRELADSDELSHYEKSSLRADVDRVLDVANRAAEFKGRAVAVFACQRAGLYEEVVLPRLVRDRALVDATPHLRPLLAVLDESHRYCAVVVDRERAWLYMFVMGRLEEESNVRSERSRKRDFGWRGFNEYGIRNRAEEQARKHWRETAVAVEDFMRSAGADLLIVGGHEDTVTRFLPFLSHELRPKVAGTFVIDPSTMSPGKVREHADQVADAFEREEERRLVAEVMERVANGGLGAVGLEECLVAASEHAVQLLLAQDDVQAPGQACDNCGWLGLDGTTCPVCESPTRGTPDIIDEMAAAVIDASGKVEHVYAETDLAKHLVAASLRFPVQDPTGVSP